MRRIATTADESSARFLVGGVLGADVRHPQRPREVLLRKGRLLTCNDLERLSSIGDVPIVVLLPDDELDENAAAARIAATLAGPDVEVSTPHQGTAVLHSARRGFFRVDGPGLAAVNAHEGVLAFSAADERPVDRGAALAAVKVAPLLLPERIVQCVENAAKASAPVINLLQVPVRQVRLIGTTRLASRARRRAEDSLTERLGWYGSMLTTEWTSPNRDALIHAFRRSALSDLILVATTASMDPEDVVFDALRSGGGSVDQVGIPIEPGTACWVGRLGDVSVFGLASCELFGSPGAFDVLLPRLLLGEHPDAATLAWLARGGLLLDGPPLIPHYANPRVSSRS